MTTFAKKPNLALVSVLLILQCLIYFQVTHAQPVDIGAAKKEAKVVVYGSVPPQAMNVIHKAFEAKYGIKVDYWRAAPNKVLERAVSEWRAGHAGGDVIESNRAVQLLAKGEGLYTKFIPQPTEKFSQQFREKDGLITPWRFNPVSILYNTELVKESERPKKYEDLLEPKWRKKIAMPDPTQHVSTAQFLKNLEAIMGPKWLDFAERLARQEPHMVESFAPVPNAIVKGEASVGITYVKYVKQFKGPLDYVMLDKFLADANYLGLTGKSAHPHAAKLYTEYLTSAEGQKAIAAEAEFVLYPGVRPDIKGAEEIGAKTVFMDAPTEDEFKKLGEQFRKMFFGK